LSEPSRKRTPRRALLSQKIDSLRGELAEFPELHLRRSPTERQLDNVVVFACALGLARFVWVHWQSISGALIPLGFVVNWALRYRRQHRRADNSAE
jgi:hypothetical protein